MHKTRKISDCRAFNNLIYVVYKKNISSLKVLLILKYAIFANQQKTNEGFKPTK